jgi:hypothetical protein
MSKTNNLYIISIFIFQMESHMLDLLGLEIISTNETEEAELDNNAPSIECDVIKCFLANSIMTRC